MYFFPTGIFFSSPLRFLKFNLLSLIYNYFCSCKEWDSKLECYWIQYANRHGSILINCSSWKGTKLLSPESFPPCSLVEYCNKIAWVLLETFLSYFLWFNVFLWIYLGKCVYSYIVQKSLLSSMTWFLRWC